MQDSTQTALIQRKVSCHKAYGFVASKKDDRADKNLLISFAVEYMADMYAFVSDQLTQLEAPVAQSFTIPKEPQNKTGELLRLLPSRRRNRIGVFITDFAPLMNIGPAQPEPGKYIQIDKKWQYGVSGKDRFIVYHPKTRKPFDVNTEVATVRGSLVSIS